MRYETALQIASIIEKELYEFTTSPDTSNILTCSEPGINNMKIDGNADGNVAVKIISVFEELLALLKQHFKYEK